MNAVLLSILGAALSLIGTGVVWRGLARWVLAALGLSVLTGSGAWYCDVNSGNVNRELCSMAQTLAAFSPPASPAAPPTVGSISRVDTNPTSQENVSYQVQFDQDVTGVDTTDFEVITTGDITGAQIVSVEGSGSTYRVVVSTGTAGDGTVQLNLRDDNTIRSSRGVPLAGDSDGSQQGPPYTVQRVVVQPPLVQSITPLDANPTNQPTVRYQVQFSQNVTGVDRTDFSVVTGGNLAGARINSVTGSGNLYQVTVSTGTGSGTLQLNLRDDDTIQNDEAVPLGGVGAGNGSFQGQPPYTIQRAEPSPPSPTPPSPTPSPEQPCVDQKCMW